VRFDMTALPGWGEGRALTWLSESGLETPVLRRLGSSMFGAFMPGGVSSGPGV
jgi:hypothetical protein